MKARRTSMWTFLRSVLPLIRTVKDGYLFTAMVWRMRGFKTCVFPWQVICLPWLITRPNEETL